MQPMEADTSLLLKGLFPINNSPHFSLGMTEVVRGVRMSRRLSGRGRLVGREVVLLT